MIHFLRMLNLPCRDMTRLMSRSQDESLGWRERFAVRAHLLYCRACRRFGRQVRLLRVLLRSAAAEEKSPDVASARLSPAARARIRAALLEQPE